MPLSSSIWLFYFPSRGAVNTLSRRLNFACMTFFILCLPFCTWFLKLMTPDHVFHLKSLSRKIHFPAPPVFLFFLLSPCSIVHLTLKRLSGIILKTYWNPPPYPHTQRFIHRPASVLLNIFICTFLLCHSSAFSNFLMGITLGIVLVKCSNVSLSVLFSAFWLLKAPYQRMAPEELNTAGWRVSHRCYCEG